MCTEKIMHQEDTDINSTASEMPTTLHQDQHCILLLFRCPSLGSTGT